MLNGHGNHGGIKPTIGMKGNSMRSTIIYLLIACLLFCGFLGRTPRKVHQIERNVPELPKMDIRDPDRFLNDLKLSPYWKVEKDRDGSLIARARSIKNPRGATDNRRMFLFELAGRMKSDLPKDFTIRNKYLERNDDFSSFSI